MQRKEWNIIRNGGSLSLSLPVIYEPIIVTLSDHGGIPLGNFRVYVYDRSIEIYLAGDNI